MKEGLDHRSINSHDLHPAYTLQNRRIHSATARTVEEAQKLTEQGFKYVCNFDGIRLFRKRK